MLKFIIFALAGKLLIYLAQKFPFAKLPFVGKLFCGDGFMAQLFSCDLCLGVWVYFLLSALSGIRILDEIIVVPIVSEFMTGAITSFITHLISLGWNTKFQVLYIEE